MTNTLRALAALCLVTVGLIASGCGSSTGSGGSDPASVAPQSSFVYAEATIDPSGSQETAVRSILADLPGTGAPQDRLENLIRDAIKNDKTNKVDWDNDIKPWLGDKVAGFVAGSAAAGDAGGVPAAFVVATTDGDAARKALEKDADSIAARKTYRDVDYIIEDEDGDLTAEGIVDGYLVAGNEVGLKAAIDASKGSNLSDNSKFTQALDGVPDERVGFAYADLGGLIQFASQVSGGQVPAAALLGPLLAGKPLVISARAETQALVIEGKSLPTAGLLKGGGGDTSSLMDKMPAGAWAALALPGFGDGVRAGVRGFAGAFGGEDKLAEQLKAATGLDLERDILSWIGDVGAFVDGDSKDTLGGGVLIRSKDPDTSKQALTKIAAAITKNDPSTQVAAARIPGAFGYEFRSSEIPRRVYMVQKDDNVALTYGEDEAVAALGNGGLTGSSEFKHAADGLGAGYKPALYVSVPPILRVADAFGASDDKDYAKAKPYLTILDYLIAGSQHNSEDSSGRFRIGFKPHE